MLTESYHIYGNASVHEADIVCIVDSPTMPEVQLSIDKVIKRIWNDHTVLVGLVEKGNVLPSPHCRFNAKLIKGWDISPSLNLKEFLDEQYRIICHVETKACEILRGKNWGIIASEYSPLELLFSMVFSNPALISAEKAAFLALLTNKQLRKFSERVYWLINKAIKKYDETCREMYRLIFQARQASLMQTIDEESRIVGKKVLVLFEGHQLYDPNLQAFLRARKSVVIASNLLLPLLPENKIELWGTLAQPREETTSIPAPIPLTPSNELLQAIDHPTPPSPMKKIQKETDLSCYSPDCQENE